jgi:hypothetical protein
LLVCPLPPPHDDIINPVAKTNIAARPTILLCGVRGHATKLITSIDMKNANIPNRNNPKLLRGGNAGGLLIAAELGVVETVTVAAAVVAPLARLTLPGTMVQVDSGGALLQLNATEELKFITELTLIPYVAV